LDKEEEGANMAITIGIPKALVYYENGELWQGFFKEIGWNVICSPNTNKQLLETGKKYLVDESCLPMKIYMGHIDYLSNKCDYILIPYLEVINKKEEMCTNFLSLYDLAKNLFEENKILNYHVNLDKNQKQEDAFIKMMLPFGFKKKKILKAYKNAHQKALALKSKNIKDNIRLLKNQDKIKLLLVSHSYNTYDGLIGKPITSYLEKQNVNIIHAHLNNCKTDKYKYFSKTLYWSYSKNLINGLALYEKHVDGIIFLTAFPCGPDSLVNELCIAKVEKPAIQIIIDELSSEVGLETRLESFLDILERKKVIS